MTLDKTHSQKLMLKPEVWYGFTLNGDEQFDKSKTIFRFPEVYSHCLHQLEQFRDIFPDIEIYPEFSPGRTTGKYKGSIPRLHFHGKCQVDNRNFYTYGAMKVERHYTYAILDKVDIQYCIKNKDVMQKWCTEVHLPYKITYENIKKARLVIDKWRRRRTESQADRDAKSSNLFCEAN